MSLVPDIVESWRAPRRVLRRHMARPRSEAFLFTFLFTFLLIAFVAQAPYAARLAHFQPEVPMPQRLFAAFLGLIATLPLWYGLAALSRLVARALGGQGSWYGARLALFDDDHRLPLRRLAQARDGVDPNPATPAKRW